MTSNAINFSTKLIIGGRPVDSKDGKSFNTINPANGEILTSISEATVSDVDIAVKNARQAFESGPWGKMSPAERKKILLRFATVIEAHTDELAMMESMEAGKPITDCLEVDLPETVNTIRWHAEAIDKIYDQISPTEPGVISMITREPIGIVAAILPWNFPLLMAAWKIGPILASGNCVILKPAEQTSLSTIRLAELATEAGLPDGVINVLPGFGETIGKALGVHSDVDCIAFTGSTETGRLFLKYSADSNLKKVLLECGGKNPLLVMEDVDDLDTVADHAANAIFWNMGENCSSNSRVIIHKNLKKDFLDIISEKTKDWIIGDPLEPSTKIGPLIEENHLEKVLNHINQAKKDGAKLIIGGEKTLIETGGYFVQPTIFDEVDPKMSIFHEEVFGPVLSITEFEDPEEAINLANNNKYGLAASVFTNSNKTAHVASKAIKAGTITVNCYGEGDVTTPFGGYKLSGFGGRDKSLEAHFQYCELKTTWIDLKK